MVESSEEKTRILLIDDEQNILRTFRYCLEDAGHRVHRHRCRTGRAGGAEGCV